VVFCLGLACSVLPGLAYEGAATVLPPRAVWPFQLGPVYAPTDERGAGDQRQLRLAVGSFNTRSEALAIPVELAFDTTESSKPGRPWIVQIDGPITEEKKARLMSQGLKLLAYLPNNAFVVRVADPARLTALEGVVWAGPYHPAYRLSPEIGRAPAVVPSDVLGRALDARVQLLDGGDQAAVIERLMALGAAIDRDTTFQVDRRTDRIYFHAPFELLLRVASFDEVFWVVETPRYGVLMNAESKGVLQSGVPQQTPMWDAGINGSTQVVGDMDNGMDVDTVLLSNTAADAGAPGDAHRKVKRYTAYGGGDLATCSGTGGYSHGTNTAQNAVGNRTDFGQGGEFEGIAKAGKVVFQDIGPTNTIACLLGQLSPPSTLIAMYDEVRAQGGHLTNGSFSICSGYGSHAFDADQYTWDKRDFLMTFSAGNGGNGMVCPGTAKNVIGAGGFYQHPFFTFYGATGPATGGRMGPTVLAPACDNAGGNPAPFDYNTSAHLASNDNDIIGTPGSAVSQGSCGTSFSSPYAMGAAALIRDYFAKGYYPTGAAVSGNAFQPSGALVKAALLNSGELMSCGNCGANLMDTSQGMGRVFLKNTLFVAGDARTAPGLKVVDKGLTTGIATGQTQDVTVQVNATTAPLRVTLGWADRPGDALINNLRLSVIGPAGTPAQTYHGRNFQGQWTRSVASGGTTDDASNPFESVFIPSTQLVTGTWTLRVTGTNVPQPDPLFGNTLPYALIASGPIGDAPVVQEVSGPQATQQLVTTQSTGANVTWLWELLPEPGTSYNLYRGDLEQLAATGVYSHTQIGPTQCGVATNSVSVADRQDGQRRYYLVAAKRSGSEGPLGKASNGTNRPAASSPCP
jgi:hypothetical protein